MKRIIALVVLLSLVISMNLYGREYSAEELQSGYERFRSLRNAGIGLTVMSLLGSGASIGMMAAGISNYSTGLIIGSGAVAVVSILAIFPGMGLWIAGGVNTKRYERRLSSVSFTPIVDVDITNSNMTLGVNLTY